MNMNRSNKGADTNTLQIVFDAGLCTCVFLLSLFLTTDIQSIFYFNKQNTFILFLFIILYILANQSMRVYNRTTFYYPDRIFKCNTLAFALASVTLIFLQYIAEDGLFDEQFLFVFLPVCYLVLIAGTQLFHRLGHNRVGKYTTRILLVGTKEKYEKYLYYVNKTNTRISVVGYLEESALVGLTEAERVAYFDQYIRSHAADKVCIMETELDRYKDIADLCLRMGITVELVINHAWNDINSCYVSAVGTYPVVIYHTISFNSGEQFVKRVLDIVGSVVGLILASPIMLGAAIAIKLDSPGPVLFSQTRVGMNGRQFKMYKFRTMYVDAEARKQALMAQNEMSDGRMFKLKNDPRITPVGRFLRNTSIDELPQLFNVLINDMSLVGTRPPTVDEVEQYERDHWRRISIKPGITGMWQISGRSSITNFEEVVQLDVSYIDGWNILRDLRIIFQTVGCVLKKQGAC